MSFALPADDDFMAPTALNGGPGSAPVPATKLVIATQSAAKDGSFQSLVESLGGPNAVDTQMLDRITDGATTLPRLQYTHVAVLVPSSDVSPALLAAVELALAGGARLDIRNSSTSDESIQAELRLLGLNPDLSNGFISAAKPASSQPISLSLRKRPQASTSGKTSRAEKASLWALTTPSTSGAATPTIDESTLLTAEDLERPTLVQRPDCDVKRTRKACKNCTCGLRELLLDEKEDDDLVAAGFAAPSPLTSDLSNGADVKKIRAAPMTSSCGSCFLGDAFRCASCPFLGMPAFEPGEKVTIPVGMDDI